jgi:MoaA/NifB/PqqE/SkfB family radical SAM enzyme
MLSIDQLQGLLYDLDEMGVFEITLTGGEPTLRKGIELLLNQSRDFQASALTVITNAARYDREYCDWLIAQGLLSVRVSVDGTRPIFERIRLEDAFENVLRNLSYFSSRLTNVRALTTVMAPNFDDVLCLADVLRRNGVPRQDLIVVRAFGRAARDRGLLLGPDQILDLKRRVGEYRWEHAGEGFDLRLNAPHLFDPPAGPQDVVMFPYWNPDSSIAISGTGDVTVSRLNSVAPIGNVKDTPIADIWRRRPRGGKECGVRNYAMNQELGSKDPDECPTDSYAALLDRQIFAGAEVR